MQFGLTEVIILFGVMQCLLLFAALTFRTQSRWAHSLFGVILLMEGIILFENLMIESGSIDKMPHLAGVSILLTMLKAPLMLLFAQSITINKFRFRWTHLLHLLPAFFTALLLINFFLLPAGSKVDILQKSRTMNWFDNAGSLFMFVYTAAVFGVYLVLAVRCLVNAERTKLGIDSELSWIKRIFIAFLVCFMINLTISIISGITRQGINSFNIYSMMIMSFVIQSIGYSLVYRSRLSLKAVVPSDPHEVERLIEQLTVRKVYLEDDLTVTSLASKMKIPVSRLSDLFQQQYGKSFKETLNNLRVEEAKRLMQLNGNHSLMAIANESGFNNKVSFYRAFKRHTGLSPSAYFRQKSMAH